MPILYSLRRTADGYLMAKFDPDFNLAGVYTLSPSGPGLACDCPAGHRPTCKHRKMVVTFATAGNIDSDRFYCYETQTWHQPIPTYGEGEATAEKAAAESERTIPTEAAGPTLPVPGTAPEIIYYEELPATADVAKEFSRLLAAPPTKSFRRI